MGQGLGDRTCVLLDLDNTVFDHRYALTRGLTAVRAAYAEELGGRSVGELADLHESALEVAYRRGANRGSPARTVAEVRTAIFLQRTGAAGAIEPQALSILYEEAYLSHRRATPGSIELLGRLRDAGRSRAIVTDGSRSIQREKAEAIGAWPLLDAMVTSEEVGAMKPDLRIFEAALDFLGAEAGDAVMIGDHLERDVGAAMRAGIAAIHYLPEPRGSDQPAGLGAPAVRRMRDAAVLLGC